MAQMSIPFLLGPGSLVPVMKLPEIQSDPTFDQENLGMRLPEIQSTIDTNLTFLQQIQKILNRNPPRLKRKFAINVRQSTEDEPQKKRKTEKVHVIRGILAVDPVSGHVLVQYFQGDNVQWLPYVYLRWACPSLVDKHWLETEVFSKSGMAVPVQYAMLPRTPITEFMKVVPTHYVPELNDGTAFGQVERVMYRIFGRNRIGLTPLYLIHDQPGIAEFVQQKRAEIKKTGKNVNRLTKIMGLNVQHDDIGFRFFGSNFPFRHFSFGPMNRERLAVTALEELKKK
jgi:hypothetical protein